jgi:hypothetical protein
MPLTAKGEKIESAMKNEYGAEKGEQVFNASKNAGTIKGVDGEPGAGAAQVKAASANVDPINGIMDASTPAIDISSLPMSQSPYETQARNYELWPVNDGASRLKK